MLSIYLLSPKWSEGGAQQHLIVVRARWRTQAKNTIEIDGHLR